MQLTSTISAQSDRLLRRPEVLARIGNPHVTSLYRWMAEGSFPRPVRLAKRMVAWRSSDVDAWLASRQAT